MPASSLGSIAQGLLLRQVGGDSGNFSKSRGRLGELFFEALVPLSVLVIWAVQIPRLLEVVEGSPEFFYISKPIPWLLSRPFSLFLSEQQSLLAVVILCLLVLGPVFYFWSRRLLGLQFDALVASWLFFSLVFYWADKGAWLGSWWGGAEQMIAWLPFVLTCYYLVEYMQRGTLKLLVFCVISLLMTILTSGVVFMYLMMALVILTGSEVLLGEGRVKIHRWVLVCLLGLGLSACCYNSLFTGQSLAVFFSEGMWRFWLDVVPLVLVLTPILGTIVFLICERRPRRQGKLVSSSLLLELGLVNLFWFSYDRPLWVHPERLLLSLAFPSSLVLGWMAGLGFKGILASEKRIFRWFPVSVRGLGFLSLLFLAGTGVIWGGYAFWSIRNFSLSGWEAFQGELLSTGSFSWIGLAVGLLFTFASVLLLRFLQKRWRLKDSTFWSSILEPF